VTTRNETIQYPDGRVELKPDAFAEISASPLFNRDLAPVKVSERNWTTYNYAALWISMAHCIPTYIMASGLISHGMNWWQALITILLGNSIVLIPILLNSHPGTKYGIPFPVFARAAYGTYGSNLAALMRAIVACGWFGIQAWIGGKALHVFFSAIIPGWANLLGTIGDYQGTQWIAFLLFWAMNIYIIFRGMNLLRKVENWAAPFVLIMTALLLVWAIAKAHGLGYLLTQEDKFHSIAEFWPVFIPSLTAMIGFWATLSLNMPDFTRFGHSQREQAIGQVVALPTTMTIFAAMGVIITSAAVVIYPNVKPDELWDPMNLVSHFQQVIVVAISMFTVVVATLAVNIAANVVSPANDFTNAFPRWISFRTGGLITGIIGVVMMPWKLVADPSGYIFTWLVGYSALLGPIGGIMIADYYVWRRRQLHVAGLYRADGEYRYTGGFSWIAIFALIIAVLPNLPGFLATVKMVNPASVPAFFVRLYDYAWFVGFAIAFVCYLALRRVSKMSS
jgi:NCS1 family nucleobase:cation symporter-1